MDNEESKVQVEQVEPADQTGQVQEQQAEKPEQQPAADRALMADALRNKWTTAADFYGQRRAASLKAGQKALQSLSGTRMPTASQVRQRVMGVPTTTGYAQPQQQPGSIFDMAQGAR